MGRRIVCEATVAAGLLAAAFAAIPQPTHAACGGTERRLMPNGKFEYVQKQDCYPDLHSAPMTNTPRDTPDMPSQRCHERMPGAVVLQPNGRFHTRSVERCG